MNNILFNLRFIYVLLRYRKEFWEFYYAKINRDWDKQEILMTFFHNKLRGKTND